MTEKEMYASIRFSNFGYTPEEGPFNVASAITPEKARFIVSLIDEYIRDISIHGEAKFREEEVDDFKNDRYYDVRRHIRGEAIMRNFIDDFLFDAQGVYLYIKEAMQNIKKDNPYKDNKRVPKIYECIDEKIKSLKLHHKKKTYINYFDDNKNEDVHLVYDVGRLVGVIGRKYVSCYPNYILFIQNSVNDELKDEFIYSQVITTYIEESLKKKLEEERNWI